MGRFAKLLLRLPGEKILLISPVDNLQNDPVGTKTVLNFDPKKSFQFLSRKYSKSFIAALRSIGLRCMEHLFFLRIVGEVSFSFFNDMRQQNCRNLLSVGSVIFSSNDETFSGEHQRDWLASVWPAGGRPGLSWDLWQKSDRTKLQPWQDIEIGATQLGFLKIFNHLVFKPTPAMNSIVYVERERMCENLFWMKSLNFLIEWYSIKAWMRTGTWFFTFWL